MNLRDSTFTLNSLDQNAASATQSLSRAAVNPVSASGALADMIVNDLLPNAANKILSAFPSIKNNMGNETLDIEVSVKYIDGANKKLAFASFKYYPKKNDRGFEQKLQVDSADFTTADADGTGNRVEVLQSTIAHEFMHSVMQFTLHLYRMDTNALGLTDTNVRTAEDAGLAIDEIKSAIGYVSYVRSEYGSVQNRLEHTISNLNNITENTTASESHIRDADMAEEMVEYSVNQIPLQAGQAMLTQANQQSNYILSLLGS